MPKLSAWSTLWISAATLAGLPLRGGMTGVPATDPAIERVAEAYRTAVLARDAAAVAAVFRDDAVEMPPCHPPVRGRAAIERYYREFFGAPQKLTEFLLSPSEVVVAGDFAYNVGTARRTISVPGGPPLAGSGKYMVLLKRSGADWKVAYAIYNDDQAAPPMPPGAAR